MYNNSSIVAFVFIAVGLSLPSHCLATIGGGDTDTVQGDLIRLQFIYFSKICEVG
jgi:hypothetical protein